MFDSLKNLGNLGQLSSLMGKAQKLQEEMKKMQEQLASKRITGDAGGERVTATVNGRMELLDIHIDATRVDMTNVEMVQELCTAAVRSAQYRAAEHVRQEMQRISNEVGIDPNMLPGAMQ